MSASVAQIPAPDNTPVTAEEMLDAVRRRAQCEHAGRWRMVKVQILDDDGRLLEFAEDSATHP